MPYIDTKARDELDWAERGPESPGELNYQITMKILDYMRYKPKSYAMYNEVIGVLECCKQELYRRVVATYENDKWEVHGDVYE